VDHDQSLDVDRVSTRLRSTDQQRRTTLIPVSGSIPRARLRSTPKSASGFSASQFKSRPPLRHVKVEVLITYDRSETCHAHTAFGLESSAHDLRINTEMTVSTWTWEYNRYFTITLSIPPKSLPPAPSRRSTVAMGPVSEEQWPPSYAQPQTLNTPKECPYCGYDSISRTASPANSPFSSLSVSTLRMSEKAIEQSVFALKNLVGMKDAMLDATDIPIIAMWGDGSSATHNKAVTRLLQKDGDPVSEEAGDILSRMKVYTEDFGRRLETHEYPIVKICRDLKGTPGVRFGIIDSKSNKRVFECVGSAIYNEKTGKFEAGVSAWKEVTWYLQLIKAQSEQNDRQFQLICEKIPHMVSRPKPSFDMNELAQVSLQVWTTDASGNPGEDYEFFRWRHCSYASRLLLTTVVPVHRLDRRLLEKRGMAEASPQRRYRRINQEVAALSGHRRGSSHRAPCQKA